METSAPNLKIPATPLSLLILYLASLAFLSYTMPIKTNLNDPDMSLVMVFTIITLGAWIIPIGSFSPYILAALWPYVIAYVNLVIPLVALVYWAFPLLSNHYVVHRMSYSLVLVFLVGKAQYAFLHPSIISWPSGTLWFCTLLYVMSKLTQDTIHARLESFRRRQG